LVTERNARIGWLSDESELGVGGGPGCQGPAVWAAGRDAAPLEVVEGEAEAVVVDSVFVGDEGEGDGFGFRCEAVLGGEDEPVAPRSWCHGH